MAVTAEREPLQGFALLEQWLAWRETCLAQVEPDRRAQDQSGSSNQ